MRLPALLTSVSALALGAVLLTVPACEEQWIPDARFVSVAGISGFDPVDAGDAYAGGAQDQVFEGLYEYHYLKRPLELQPAIADGMPEVSEDGLTYTFKLKKGIVFQDDECFDDGKGREVTAHDFVWCIKRLMGMPSSTGDWLLADRIVGLDDWKERCRKHLTDNFYDRVNEHYAFEHDGMRELIAEEVEGLRAIDDHTLQVILIEPYPQFVWTLAMTYTAVYPREALEYYGVDFRVQPVGSGPYRVDEYWPFDLRIRFERNPTYRETYYPSDCAPDDDPSLLEDAGKRLPLLDKVEFVIVESAQPRWLQFLEGRFERVETEKNIWDEAMKDGALRKDVAAKGVVVHVGQKFDVAYTGFNMEDPVIGLPAGDKGRKVRQAMSMAYDTAGWIKVMRNGYWGIPAKGPVPPGMVGYAPVPNPNAEQNIARAKELLEEAGYPGGRGLPKLVYEMSGTTSTTRNGAEILRTSLQAIGIELDLRGNTWPQFMVKVRDKSAQMYGMAWNADYPDAQNFLQLFYGPYESPGPNNSNYKNDEYDKLYDEMKVLQPTDARRDEIIKRMIEILVEDCPWSFTDHRVQYTYAQGWLENFKYHSINTWMFKYYDVDRDEREKRIGRR